MRRSIPSNAMIRAPATAVLVLVLGATIAAPPLTAQQRAGAAPLEVLFGFTLIDGRGGPPIEDAAMAIRGNEILTVSTRRELLSGPNAIRDAVVTNLGGGYVIPGLIDAHVHLATAPNRARAEAELSRLLYGGVVAVRDMAGDARALASLARDTRLGQIEGPDVYFSALMAGPSFLTDPRPQSSAAGEAAGAVPWMQAVTPRTDLVRAIARAKGTYATGVKIYADLSPDLVTAITEEAHRQEMKVWAHSMVFPARPLEVVRSGVDAISHVCRLAWEGMARAPDRYHHDEAPLYGSFSETSPVFTELFDAMRAHGTILDVTLALYARRAEAESAGTASRTNRQRARGSGRSTPMDGRRGAGSGRKDEVPAGQSDPCDLDFARALVARANEEGVPIAAGTDFTPPPDHPFPALYDELVELVEHGGLSPMDAIGSATRTAARAVGVEDRYGTLQHGRPVSFVLLAESPLEDVANLRTIRATWKNGERFDRASYHPRVVEAELPTPTRGLMSAQATLDAWIAMWRHYDLDAVDDIFLPDRALTYFGSDARGLIEGLDAVRAYHEAQGFVPGGFRPEADLWLEDTVIADFDDSAVVSAVWHFGNPVSGSELAHGPMTMVIVRTEAGYRISHLNMANYPRG